MKRLCYHATNGVKIKQQCIVIVILKMKTKEDYKLAQVVVKKVIDDWDLYALLNGGAPDDDFASEMSKIISRLP